MHLPWKVARGEFPLISVITPTWQRHDWIVDCVKSVAQQTYRPIQHIVISDGPDPELGNLLLSNTLPGKIKPGYSLDIKSLPEHVDGTYSERGKDALLCGLNIAAGDILAYIDDDHRYQPDHLQRLECALYVNPQAGFAYSSARVHRYMNDIGYLIGEKVPRLYQIDTGCLMHHRELLNLEPWRFGPEQQTRDWDIVQRWMKAGIKWVWSEPATVDIYPSLFRDAGWNPNIQYQERNWNKEMLAMAQCNGCGHPDCGTYCCRCDDYCPGKSEE